MNRFDRWAERVDEFVSHAPFFLLCALLVIAWAVALPIQGWDNQVWHLALNSPTTSVTFLLVGLAANSARRSNKALHAKLDALLERVAELPDTDTEKALAAQGIEAQTDA